MLKSLNNRRLLWILKQQYFIRSMQMAAFIAYVEYMTWIPRVINVLFTRGSNVGKSTLKRR